MLETIKEACKLYLKKAPYFALLVLLLLAYEFLSQKAFDSVTSKFGIYTLLFLGPIVYTSVELLIYRSLLNVKFGRAWGFIKKMILFIITHVVYGFVFMLPVFLIRYLLAEHCPYWMPIAFVINVFAAFWLLARASIVFPMIMAGDKITPKTVWNLTKGSYGSWLLPAILVYLPYVMSYYLVSNMWVNLALTSVLSMWVLTFTIVYYQSKKVKSANTKKA